MRRPRDDARMATQRNSTRRPPSKVAGDGRRRREPRLINEPADEHESSFLAGASIGGAIVGALIGAGIGLVAAAFPVVTWWMGLMIGALCGLVLAGLVMARLGIRSIQDESLPPDVRRHGERNV